MSTLSALSLRAYLGPVFRWEPRGAQYAVDKGALVEVSVFDCGKQHAWLYDHWDAGKAWRLEGVRKPANRALTVPGPAEEGTCDLEYVVLRGIRSGGEVY